MLIKKIAYTIIIFYLFISESSARDYIIVQSTTSTKNSGLLDILEQRFENKFNIDVRFVTVGSGQAIQNAKNGDADLLIAHSTKEELEFIKEGHGAKRFDLMYNDFIIIGPLHDPARINEASDIFEVMQKLTSGQAFFISRDDDSGTHQKELSLWHLAGIEINENDRWYIKNGSGMGTTLNMASEIDAYTISDRGTWLSFNNKQYLDILYEKDELLFNAYGISVVNPKKFPHVEYEKAMTFINWLLSKEGKFIINEYKLNGQQLFFTY